MMDQEKVDALNEPAEDKKEWGVIVDVDDRLLRSAINPRYDEYPFEFMMTEQARKAVHEYVRVMGLK